MSRRTPPPVEPARRSPLVVARRQLARHRRPVSAALVFASVLLALGSLQSDRSDPGRQATPASPVTADQRVVALRLDDPSVTTLLSPGDVVDVIGTDQRGLTALLAKDVVVTSVSSESGTWQSSEGGLVVVATDPQTAVTLAGAGTRGSLAVTIHP